MPHSRSARKRVRQNLKHRAKNRSTKTFLKTETKKILGAVGEGNAEVAAAEYKTLVKALDKAARKRIIHPNLAARKKSRLLKRVSAAGEKGSPSAKA